uniref:Uncharacterized protein n=1 Tax=Rhizophora mucronata TaxID=61149 RepID=A0A2P2N501_RHIMU
MLPPYSSVSFVGFCSFRLSMVRLLTSYFSINVVRGTVSLMAWVVTAPPLSTVCFSSLISRMHRALFFFFLRILIDKSTLLATLQNLFRWLCEPILF